MSRQCAPSSVSSTIASRRSMVARLTLEGMCPSVRAVNSLELGGAQLDVSVSPRVHQSGLRTGFLDRTGLTAAVAGEN
eukprot:1033382-Rhodomonas_salina.1